MANALQIGIVGAGIGGLAASALLARSGHAVVLIERFVTPRPLGSGLVVQPVGLAVLDALGAGPAARALGAPIRAMLGQSGARRALDVAYRPEAPGLAMHRAALFAVLWRAVQDCGVRVITDCPVHAAPLQRDKRRVLGPGGGEVGVFDLVIDASGAGSVLSPLRARALPYGAVWGQVVWPDGATLPADQLSQCYHRASRMAGILPIGSLPGDPARRAAVFWSLPRPALDRWAAQDMAAWRNGLTDFWPAIAPFLTSLTLASQMTPARYAHGTLRRPFAERLAFIGDAAHRASPQLGQGANMALLDAFALCHALQGGLEGALARYGALRRWHLRAYQAMSAAFTPMYQSDSRLLPLLRDHVLAPLGRVWPLPGLLTALVSGDLIPPLAFGRGPG